MPAKIPIGFLLTSKELFLGSAQAMYGKKPSTKSTVILSGTLLDQSTYIKKNDLILTGAYGFPVPINEKKLIEVTSSAFGDVTSTFI